ncbi:hypothetical protein [Actinokineospora sp. NBRC 105648]|uniref:hypothetical protein n=1 Tax=Actinokineospora sp. NBRC 105648 TaxID=3032206 RepID=UPI0024A23E79|nr:hypothetical protein [Actinokineospora sp. NBRC 105648]GLZ37630.1 hypothetical protein Acsp05_12550 [Actinokineospora sp. NBRC 105648]
MPRYAYVYVGQPARANFGVGMDSLTWGWKKDSHGSEVDAAMAVLRDPRNASYLVFAQGLRTSNPPVGWPRTPAGDPAWTRASLDAITLARVTGPLREEHEPLWSDDLYPFRVSLGSVVELPALPHSALAPEAMTAVRNAALRRGLPVLGPVPVDDVELGTDDSAQFNALVPDRLLNGLDGLDGLALALVRREQKWLRRQVFGEAPAIPCSLCHRELPVSLLRLAHIKRRADATPVERLNAANTMPACTLGCDELFERGYLLVDEQGQIHRNAAAPTVTVDLNIALSELDGRHVFGYRHASASFFAAHAARHTTAREG